MPDPIILDYYGQVWKHFIGDIPDRSTLSYSYTLLCGFSLCDFSLALDKWFCLNSQPCICVWLGAVLDVCLVVVPAVEEDPHHEKGRVLVGPGDRGVNILCFAKVCCHLYFFTWGRPAETSARGWVWSAGAAPGRLPRGPCSLNIFTKHRKYFCGVSNSLSSPIVTEIENGSFIFIKKIKLWARN